MIDPGGGPQPRITVDDGPEEPAERVAWHTIPVQDAAKRLSSHPAAGLSTAEARRRLGEFGLNRLVEAPGRSALSIFLAQFRSLIVLLLVAATLIALAMGERIEGVAILIVIVLNSSIGFLTEWKAEQTLKALQTQAVPLAQVIRDGIECQVPAVALVPGDVVTLAAGARVPADGRLLETARLQIEEASLTGESLPVTKSPDPVVDPNAPPGDRTCMAFMGTTINSGRGRLLVTATGMRTELGQVGTLIEEAGTRTTPLERKLDRLGRSLVGIVLGLCACIVCVGWLRGINFPHILEVGISLAIAAVPEGLPAVATLTLAVGMQRMARMRTLVRRLPAVETLGSVTVICTDKTGTLTRNEMTVRSFVLDNRRIEVTGIGYKSSGAFLMESGSRIEPGADPHLTLALRIGALCNDARIDRTGGVEIVLGDPTEGALLVAAEKAGLAHASESDRYRRVFEVPFDSHTKRMVTVHRDPAGGLVAFVKGSPGTLLDRSIARFEPEGERVVPLTDADRTRATEWNRTLAGEALRVLGLAYRELPEEYDAADLERDLVFVGLVGMIDPLREEARAAVETCRRAGIRILMITGDQPTTAAEIGRQLGLERDAEGRPLATVHARELEDLDADGLRRISATSSIFARVSPRHKLRLVERFQRQGEIVAMTGDGVNDAPALKAADIGVAMGISGTEVAKEAAAMIITDDNFATIVSAVEQGRIIYANILKFVHYLFSCNFAEILTVFVAILAGWPLPLGPLQILWLNMITDVFPAMALALEPSSPAMMHRPPRNPREELVNRRFLGLVAWQGVLLTVVTLAAFRVGLQWHASESDQQVRAESMAFSTLALAQVVHAFNVRSQRRTIFSSRLFTNGWLWTAVGVCVVLQVSAVSIPLLQKVLHTLPPSPREWSVVIACTLAPVAVVELVKLAGRHAKTGTMDQAS